MKDQSLDKDRIYFNQEIENTIVSLHERQVATSAISDDLNNQLSLIKSLRQQLLNDAIQGKLVAQNMNDEPASELLAKIRAEKEQLIKEKKTRRENELSFVKDEEIPFEIPQNWVWCRLGELSLYSEAGKSFKCEERPITGTEWGVIKVSAVSWDSFKEEQNKIYSKEKPEDISAKIENGDFIISRANTLELVGKSVVVKNITKNLLLSDKTIRFKFSSLIDIEYLNLCNNNGYARSYYAQKGTGSSPSMKNITREHMKNLLIPLPPLDEQKRIFTKVNELVKACAELELSIIRSQRNSENLLHRALKESLILNASERITATENIVEAKSL